MSTCSRCGAAFGCAMADGGDAPCWCTELPAAVPVPGQPAACWCPACLKRHIAELGRDAELKRDLDLDRHPHTSSSRSGDPC